MLQRRKLANFYLLSVLWPPKSLQGPYQIQAERNQIGQTAVSQMPSCKEDRWLPKLQSPRPPSAQALHQPKMLRLWLSTATARARGGPTSPNQPIRLRSCRRDRNRNPSAHSADIRECRLLPLGFPSNHHEPLPDRRSMPATPAVTWRDEGARHDRQTAQNRFLAARSTLSKKDWLEQSRHRSTPARRS